jgi:DNA-directed RNA polymerase subunit M/transcription elongation factor TFIIS
MEFCEKCGAMMKPKKGNTSRVVCSCGHERMITRTTMKEKVKPSRPVEVVDDPINPLAVYPHKCKKCGFGKAQLISKGVWYTDEDEVVEYVCGKCGFHEKLSDGSKIT